MKFFYPLSVSGKVMLDHVIDVLINNKQDDIRYLTDKDSNIRVLLEQLAAEAQSMKIDFTRESK